MGLSILAAVAAMDELLPVPQSPMAHCFDVENYSEVKVDAGRSTLLYRFAVVKPAQA
jgi:hypothetical protein